MICFLVVPRAYTLNRSVLLSIGDPKGRSFFYFNALPSIEAFSNFLISSTFETIQ